MNYRQTLEDSLKTHEQRFRERKWDRMFISRSLILSKAWLSLRSSTSCHVYLIFLSKQKWERPEGRAKRTGNFILSNQNEIQFTYREAKEKHDIPESKFRSAIDELVKVGLIDIAHQGSGLRGDVSLYGISERWKKFGTEDFIYKTRIKRKQCYGFTKGNHYGKNSKQIQHAYATVG